MLLHMHCRNAKWRERRSRVDKDVRRTDRQQPFYSESRSSNIKQLRNILLTYVQYNNDLGYCQVKSSVREAVQMGSEHSVRVSLSLKLLYLAC